MRTRPLRAAPGPLPVSLLGFGGAPLGNLYAPISEAEAQATLDSAWDVGIRFFDTAPLYGFGLSEERFGEALATRQRDEFVLCSKIGRLLHDSDPQDVPQVGFVNTPNRSFRFDYSYDGVMRSHEASLRRLRVDRIDVLLVHDVDVYTHGSPEGSNQRIRELFDQGGYRALEELRGSGTVASIGAGVNEWEVCERLLGLGDFDCFLLAGRYTLLEQTALDSFLPLCVQRGVTIILGGPFNSGILATGPIEGARYNYQPASPEILRRVAKIQEVCNSHGVRLVEAALHFAFGHPAIATVIPGANSPNQVRTNAELLRARVPAALWDDLKAQDLLRQDAPVPTGPLLD